MPLIADEIIVQEKFPTSGRTAPGEDSPRPRRGRESRRTATVERNGKAPKPVRKSQKT